MKRLILFVVIISMMYGCTNLEKLTYIPKKEFLYGADFRPYTEKGFFFSPEPFKGNYDPVGIVEYKFHPPAYYALKESIPNPNYKKGGDDSPFINYYSWVQEKINLQEAVDSVYTIYSAMGADAVVNLSFELSETIYDGIQNPAVITGVTIRGFAIKRKK